MKPSFQTGTVPRDSTGIPGESADLCTMVNLHLKNKLIEQMYGRHGEQLTTFVDGESKPCILRQQYCTSRFSLLRTRSGMEDDIDKHQAF